MQCSDKASQGRQGREVGEGGEKADQVGKVESGSRAKPREGNRTNLWHLSQILTPVFTLVSLIQTTWICASDFPGIELRSCIGKVTTQHELRGINSSFSKLHCSQPQPCTAYGAGQLPSLFQAVTYSLKFSPSIRVLGHGLNLIPDTPKVNSSRPAVCSTQLPRKAAL